MAVVWIGERFLGRSREDEVGRLWAVHGTPVCSRFRIDLAAEAQGGLADFRTRAKVPNDGGVEFSAADDDGVVADAGLARRLSNHEGGKDDEGVGCSDQEIPALEFLDGGLHVAALPLQGGFHFGCHRAVPYLGIKQG
jgi:hypothetical protein